MNHPNPEQSLPRYYLLSFFHSTFNPSSNRHARDFMYLPTVGSVHLQILYSIGGDLLMTDPTNRSSINLMCG